jgi:serine/threonine-protein kinase
MIVRLIADLVVEPQFTDWLRVVGEADKVTVDRLLRGYSSTVTRKLSGRTMYDPRESTFWKTSVRSGLMDVKSLTACWDAIEPRKRDVPEHIDRRLARQAVQLKLLTFWQAQQLLAGRSTGYRVDRYLLLDVIGQGGMGRVYLARDTRLGRLVALKILAPERMSNPRAIARFQREARVGAQLQHENLVRIYDFGEYNGRFFLVMEYIEGKTIATLISEQGPMPPATAARLVRQVALGLEHAHRKALIHRDVNPYNILVTHDGTAKLADLGLAITMDEEDHVTREGATVGTFDYVAPEQARHSRAADTRSDIYSLGCTLYHMCAGRVPFPGPSLPEKLLGHQTLEATPLCQLVPGLPASLSEIVERMMKKSPDERYATPMQVALALAPYADDRAMIASPDDKSPLLVPLELERAPQSSDEAEPAAVLVESAAGTTGRQSSSGPAPNPDRGSYGADPGLPLLTPDHEPDDAADEVRLVLDPEPFSSARPSPPQPGSRQDASAIASALARIISRQPRVWVWGLIAIVLATVLLAILANR